MALQERKIQLSKAVLLKDAFTGEPVSSGIRIHSFSGGQVEKKPGGYVLFLNVCSVEFEAEAESPIYQSRKLFLQADSGAEVEEILMYPSFAYPLKAGCTAVRGRAEPGSVIQFHIEEERENGKLLEDYQKGEEQISFYRKSAAFHMIWHIQKKQGKSGEYFSLKHQEENSECYTLKQPLGSAYQKKDTVICPAQESIADKNGEFYLLIQNLPEEKCILHYSCGGNCQEVSRKTEIIRGKENYIQEEG